MKIEMTDKEIKITEGNRMLHWHGEKYDDLVERCPEGMSLTEFALTEAKKLL